MRPVPLVDTDVARGGVSMDSGSLARWTDGADAAMAAASATDVLLVRIVADVIASLPLVTTAANALSLEGHLIKNLRNNFLERELLDGDQLIKGGVYMKKLFEIQSQLLVKPPSGSRSKQKITKETYEATLLTTRSTVAAIEYLLDHVKFRYVLTRGFNSDPVESFFSCLRQFNGGNDRVGILHAAKTGNAPSSSESNAVVSLPSQHNDVPSCPVEIKRAARELSGELECVNYLVTCAR
ncbi:hypothetical protein HPB49_022413 [Dermacentor silvarum]|uniref:Uncharacterized protein n=1 Tax=Dermacentor silvarum TaxID=543639 RepID=A0ACB8CBM2_DERSI|nr:hypothetical protein HPB49_022413 [Dermacentor silvarum]